jgi:hypothetical protein
MLSFMSDVTHLLSAIEAGEPSATERSADRLWAYARAWLRDALSGSWPARAFLCFSGAISPPMALEE